MHLGINIGISMGSQSVSGENLGANIMQNPDFSGGLTSWSVNTGGGAASITVSGEQLIYDQLAGGYTSVSQNRGDVANLGSTYKVIIDVASVITPNAFRTRFGTATTINIPSSGLFVYYVENITNGTLFIERNGAVGTIVVNSIEVREVL